MNLTSIIIPTYNEFMLLQECIQSIRSYTETPYEIIVVDNGSTDGTLEYLLRESITFVSFPMNKGFPTACNAGLKIAKGSSLLLLNNDILVANNWLTNMLNCLNQAEDVGIVGPLTNYASGKQQITEPYTNLTDMAHNYETNHTGVYEEVNRLIGFCFLFKREVMSKIGWLDERFSPGHYEDDDYCHRAKLEGYRLMISKDTFIFHYGSASFVKQGEQQFKEQIDRAQGLFIEKWGFHPKELV
jgi:GT2 family glycosyltransferase